MKKLLIIAGRHLGDLVQGLQVATSAKTQVPDLQISWIVREIFAPLLRTSAVADQVYVFQRHGGVGDFLRLTREVGLTRFDAVFDFEGLLRTGLMVWRAQAERKVGRPDAREWADVFYTEKVAFPANGAGSHTLDILLQFCPLVGAKPELRGALEFREPGDLNLSFVDGREGSRPVVMFPDSRRPERCWPGFKQLTELMLRDDRRRRVVWAGNHYVPDKGAFPAAQFLNLTDNTSVVSLAALIRRAEWVVSNDSGPMHMAAALGVQTLGIFGPTDPRRFGPYPLVGRTNHVIQAPVGDLRMLSAKEVYARFQRLDLPRARAVSLP